MVWEMSPSPGWGETRKPIETGGRFSETFLPGFKSGWGRPPKGKGNPVSDWRTETQWPGIDRFGNGADLVPTTLAQAELARLLAPLFAIRGSLRISASAKEFSCLTTAGYFDTALPAASFRV